MIPAQKARFRGHWEDEEHATAHTGTSEFSFLVQSFLLIASQRLILVFFIFTKEPLTVVCVFRQASEVLVNLDNDRHDTESTSLPFTGV